MTFFALGYLLMPFRSILSVARSMSFYERQQSVTANNLANVNTDGFKRFRVAAEMVVDGVGPFAVQALDLSAGTIRHTHQPLDFAIEGDAFFVVDTPAGERLVRGGSFQLDPTGLVVNSRGEPLLGVNGPIAIHGEEVVVQADGTLVVDGVPMDQLRVVSVDAAALEPVEGGQFVAAGPLLPVDWSQVRVLQGAVEESNVNALGETVDMISTQRHFGYNIRAMNVLDDVLRTIASSLGRVRS